MLGLGLNLCVLLRRSFVDEKAHGRREHAVAPGLEGVDLRSIEADLLGDDQAGQREGEGLNEITFALIDEGIDEIVGNSIEAGQHALDHRWRQGAIDQAAVAAVHGRIGALQGLHVAPADLGKVVIEHAPEICSGLAG